LQTPSEVAHDLLSAILGRGEEMHKVALPPPAAVARN
jgi:hypothetical protein